MSSNRDGILGFSIAGLMQSAVSEWYSGGGAMLFTDTAFLLLLPVICLLFYAITPRFGATAGLGLLLVPSILFCATWGWNSLFLLSASLTVNYLIACGLMALPDERRKLRQWLFGLGMACIAGALVWFKYRSAFLPQQGYAFVDLAVPVGLSFYSFQQAVFLVDVYNRDDSVAAYFGSLRTAYELLRGYVRYAFFVAFFPRLLCGPIVYMSEISPQVGNPSFGRFKLADIEVGATLFVIGLFKKAVIAGSLSAIASPVFRQADIHTTMSAATAWVGAAAYFGQLYFDFSGYSDMALGAARLFGVRLPMNFYSPLKASGIFDYYRRWHITLTRVIARFLYTPLSLHGTRLAWERGWSKPTTKLVSRWLPMVINFVVIGLWHGAAWTYIAFGFAHGVWYVVETELHANRRMTAWYGRFSPAVRLFVGRAVFTILMILCFALFRSSSVANFWFLMQQMFANEFFMEPHLASGTLKVAAAFALAWLLPNSMQLLRNYRPGIASYTNASYLLPRLAFRWRPNVMCAAFFVAIVAVSTYWLQRTQVFIYMGF